MATDFRPVDERIRAALTKAKERAMTELAVPGAPSATDVALASARQAAIGEFDLQPLKTFYGAFVNHHSCAATDKQYMEEFKAQVWNLSKGAPALYLNGRQVATQKRNGAFVYSEFAAEHPDLVAEFTRYRTREEFDEDAFRGAYPVLHASYRAKKFELSKGVQIHLPS